MAVNPGCGLYLVACKLLVIGQVALAQCPNSKDEGVSKEQILMQMSASAKMINCTTAACMDALSQKHVPAALLQPAPRMGSVESYLQDDPPSETRVSTDQSICELDVFARPELCPNQCPYAAEMANEFCHFRCVKQNECGLLNTVPNATIPDKAMHLCRHCEVEGCRTCVAGKPGVADEHLERCQVCMPGYELTEEGECEMMGLWGFVLITVVLAVIVVVAIAWYIRVATRPCVNQAGVDFAYQVRSRSMVLQPGAIPAPYPLSTNLLKTDVAGGGTMLLFRFQFALLLWAATLLAVCFGFAIFASSDILILGNRPAKSPQVLCAVVAWGRKRQMELIWTKVSWITFAYLFSFVGAMIYAVQQTRLITRLDAEETTMSDFVAVLDGLPRMKGTEQVEAFIKEKVAQATGEEVAGVSVAWDYRSCSHQVEHEVERELCLEEGGHEHSEAASPPPGFDTPITNKILNAWHVHLHDGHDHAPTAAEMKQMLFGMESTDVAWVVFATEEGRDKAVEAVEGTGIQISGVSCTLSAGVHEPTEVLWSNCYCSERERKNKVLRGALMVFLACLAWTVLLYLPYAHYMSSFSYANGDEPGRFSECIFIGLVVGSQIGLFVCSSVAAKQACFRYESQVQKTYLLLYNAALILNLVMDIVLQSYLSYLQMVGVGAHTATGILLGDLTSFQQIFECYPMQKSIGRLLFKYCWPCTFFVPFLAEPFVGQLLPQHIGKMLVRRNPKIRGLNAAKALELGEMELGRYADVIFNVILVTCIPFIAPAYMHMTFTALIVSHLYLYFYDQVKVLRYVLKFNFSSSEVHQLGMQLFAIPTSVLAGALVFKANQFSGGMALASGYLKGYSLLAAIVGAMILHGMLHLWLLDVLCTAFKEHVDRTGSKATYADAAKDAHATYFSVNPVHCLRTKYVLDNEPEQKFWSPLQG